jgi:hypothetical protein
MLHIFAACDAVQGRVGVVHGEGSRMAGCGGALSLVGPRIICSC